jgi:hypothetical protein
MRRPSISASNRAKFKGRWTATSACTDADAVNREGHIPIELLWQYAHAPSTLSPAHTEHFKSCEVCVSILGIATLAPSADEMKRRLNIQEIPFE